MAELLSNLESNDPKLVEESKQKLHEQLNGTKESSVIYGLYEWYISSNSSRVVDVLVNIKEPHYSFLFDKISESIRSSRDNMKIQGLTLLGHIVRNQPAWIYKITDHNLMKDLLKLLKNETDILTLITALMVLIVLIPLIPSLMEDFLKDVFEIYGRLASWNCNQTGRMHEEQMAHMQVALYALFLRLYGMYPCNFLAYLREQYRHSNLKPIFCHTIKPMLDTVKMHPHLVTTSTVNETSKDRWRKMAAQDIIVECEGYSLDLPERCSHEQCCISTVRPKSTTSMLNCENPNQLQCLRVISTDSALGHEGEFFSPSMLLHCPTPPVTEKSLPTPIPFPQMQFNFQSNVQTTLIQSVMQITQDSSSPPEAAIEATPETTPVRDNRVNVRVPPLNSTIAKAHTFVTRPLSTGYNTPISSPSSPMRKEQSSFIFQDVPKTGAGFVSIKRDSAGKSLQKLIQERSQMDSSVRSPFVVVPTSPLRGVSSEIPVPSSPVPMQSFDSPLSQEDEEVSEIVRQGETINHLDVRQCDSVLHEIEGFRGTDEDPDNCELEHGSPCTEGGLHMPNSKSINDLTLRLRRLRYHSQCGEDGDKYEISTGSSPGNAVSYPNNISVRRANSCPEMKKSPNVTGKDNINEKALLETDEDGGGESQNNSKACPNGIDAPSTNKKKNKSKVSSANVETQTENIWPMPYDHLFPIIFPSLLSNNEATSLIGGKREKSQCANIYEVSDKYIDQSLHPSERDTINCLRAQVELLKQQLHFERHRKEMHATKNRRLLADAKNTKALEEHKDALTDTVRIMQGDIDDLKKQLDIIQKEKLFIEKTASESASLSNKQYKYLQSECKRLQEENIDYKKQGDALKEERVKLEDRWQDSEANLLNALAEVKIAKEQAEAGEKGKIELEYVNKQLLLLGELQVKYQERLNELELLKGCDVEQKRLSEVYKHDLQAMNLKMETMRKNLEACAARISELEGIIQKQDEATALQKRQLNDVNGEWHEKLKAVESKYRTQLATNRCLEEKIVDLWQRLEILSKKVISPDISSCHEVNATTSIDRAGAAHGFSSQSSPLSASLASSEGSSMASTIAEVKNLQVM